MGISQDSWHKRRKTGGKRKPIHKKRKYELGRPAANTKVRLCAVRYDRPLLFLRLVLNESTWFVVVVVIQNIELSGLTLATLLGLPKVISN